MTLIEPKPSPRPWFAMWRRESGTFAQLPLLARAIFAEILKLTDDDGEIDIGTRQPADAIAWALGADRADRRALAKYVPMLIADGCLVHRGQTLIAPSFDRWQPTAKRPRTSNEPTANEHEAVTNEHEAVTNEPRTDHEPVAMVSRSLPQTGANPAESLKGERQSRVEESRVEEVEQASCAPASPDPGPLATREALLARLLAALHRGWDGRYRKRLASPSPASHHTQLRPLATWCAEYLETHADDTPDALTTRLLDAFWSRTDFDRPKAQWLAEDPLRYVTGTDARQQSRKPRKVTDRLAPGSGEGFLETDIDVGGCGL